MYSTALLAPCGSSAMPGSRDDPSHGEAGASQRSIDTLPARPIQERGRPGRRACFCLIAKATNSSSRGSGSSHAPTSCLCSGCSGSGTVALPWVIAASTSPTSLGTPTFVRRQARSAVSGSACGTVCGLRIVMVSAQRAAVLGGFAALRMMRRFEDAIRDGDPVIVRLHNTPPLGDVGNALVDARLLKLMLAADGRLGRMLRAHGVDEATVDAAPRPPA
jgi:hypothetical protein